MYSLVREKIKKRREEYRSLQSVYEKTLKEEREKFAEERAIAKVDAVRQKAKERARSGGIIKRAVKQLNKHRKTHKGPEFGFGSKGKDLFGSGSGPQFGLDKKKDNPFDIKVKKR